MRNLAVRQRLLELLDAFVGDPGAAEVQVFQIDQLFEMLQPGVGDVS